MAKRGWAGIIVATAIAGAGWAVCAAPAASADVEAALDRGDAQQAAGLADTALSAKRLGKGARARLLLYRGLARELLGSQDPAMGDLSAALDTHALSAQDQAQALLQRGFLRDGLGRLDEAVADYTSVIALKGDGLATALDNRANIYRRQNRLEQAGRDYQAALSAGGKPQYAWYGLGQIAEAKGDTQAARDLYAKAVAADPGYALASQRLAALGGAPDSAADAASEVTVRPLAAPSGAAATTAAAAKVTDGPIALHPPDRAAPENSAPVVLHPPAGVMPHPLSRRTAQTHAHMATAEPAGLRPALDQSLRPALSAKGAEVQLGAWRSEAEAMAGWKKAQAKAAGTLDGLSPRIVTADLPGKGRYYRLRIAPGTRVNRMAFCTDLAARGVTCLPARD